jgi:hypothetical protein
MYQSVARSTGTLGLAIVLAGLVAAVAASAAQAAATDVFRA